MKEKSEAAPMKTHPWARAANVGKRVRAAKKEGRVILQRKRRAERRQLRMEERV